MRVLGWVVVVMAMACAHASADAEVLPVPAAVRALTTPKTEQLVLRSPAGVVLGEQGSSVVVDGDRLALDVATRFTNGDEWDEHGALDLAGGFHARRFVKTMRRAGRVVQEQHVDFTTGKVEWLVDGVHAERTMTFAPDTYIGPMLAIVLAGVSERAAAATRFEALVFRPDPVVVTLRADATDAQEVARVAGAASASGLRVKADLGPVKNVLFASLIPTHYFWFSRGAEPELVSFAGKLGNGLEVVMTPETPATTTAHAR